MPTPDLPASRRATPDSTIGDLGQRTLRKVRRRLLPLIVVLYLIAYLDRNNVGFAQVDMGKDIGLNAAAYGLGAGIFFIGYTIMEVPSNGAMYRYGARKWIARILITWGICAAAMALVSGPISFYIVRLLLGVAEAGFFPAVLFYFTLWFPAAQRVAVLGIFVLAQPVSSAIGSPISGLVLNLDGVAGLHGWQWLFLIEGLPAIIMGIITPFVLTDRPEDAKWLAPDEREWLTSTMAAESAQKRSHTTRPFLTGLKDSRAIAYGLLNFGMVCGVYGLGLWLPTIVDALGKFSKTELGLLVMIPYVASIPCVYYWSRRADRTGQRALHASVSLILAAIGLVGAGYLLTVNAALALVFLSVSAIGIYSAIAPMLSMPSAIFSGAAAAAGLGLVNALGNVGGFVAPYLVGLIKTATGDSKLALLFLAACLAVTGIITYLYAARRPEGTSVVPETTH